MVGILAVPAPPATAAPKLAAPYDFDGNGYADLAIGAPSLRVGTVKRAGGVIVLPSSKKGPSRHEKVVTQSSRGVPGSSEKDDLFGYALASADFNRDGYADLAIGQPGEAIGEAEEAGSVTVVYGSRTGLRTSGAVTLARPGGNREAAQWGASLAALDFNSDGYPDLAAGAPGSDYYDAGLGGVVGILPGGARGLGTRPIAVINGEPERDPEMASGDGDVYFGADLATGDLNRDSRPDLVIMSGGESSEGDTYSGSITTCLQSAGGQAACSRLLHDEFYGGLSAVAVGNMSGDATPEIAVGAPNWGDESSGEDSVIIVSLQRSGGVAVKGLTDISEDSRGVPGSSNSWSAFGTSLAMGDIDRDGYSDLVVGAPGENAERGQVTIIHGARTGWKTAGNYTYSQSTKHVPGRAEKGDWFGFSVTLLDLNRDGRLDLTIGAPGEDKESGMITTLPGSGQKFAPSTSHTFGLKTLGYKYRASADFGWSLGR